MNSLAIQTLAPEVEPQLDAETREKVANEQLRMVWSHAAVGTIVATIFAAVMAAQFGEIVGTRLAQWWMLLKVLVALPRIIQAQVYRRRGFRGDVGDRQRARLSVPRARP